MTEPLISVLMGVYNTRSREMLRAAVGSILHQTHQNLEVIVCDDGSDHAVWQWLQELAAEDARIILLRNETNQCLAASLNRCIKASQGAYLARQDDDDISEPERLERELAFLQQHPEVEFVGCNCSLYNLHSGIIGQRKMPAFPQPKDFRFNSPFIHGTLLFRRTCLLREGGYPILEGIHRYEDYALFMQLYAEGCRGANLQETLYRFYYDNQERRVPFRERLDEFQVRREGFRKMGLLPGAVPYLIKPLLLGLLPQRWVHHLRECLRER